MSLLYDSEGATENHANREEIVKARAEGKAIVTRDSETLGAYLIYSARKVGDKVVRLAVPYRSAMEPIRLAKTGLVSAALLGGSESPPNICRIFSSASTVSTRPVAARSAARDSASRS